MPHYEFRFELLCSKFDAIPFTSVSRIVYTSSVLLHQFWWCATEFLWVNLINTTNNNPHIRKFCIGKFPRNIWAMGKWNKEIPETLIMPRWSSCVRGAIQLILSSIQTIRIRLFLICAEIETKLFCEFACAFTEMCAQHELRRKREMPRNWSSQLLLWNVVTTRKHSLWFAGVFIVNARVSFQYHLFLK